jgi:ribosome assembly protein SQT1
MEDDQPQPEEVKGEVDHGEEEAKGEVDHGEEEAKGEVDLGEDQDLGEEEIEEVEGVFPSKEFEFHTDSVLSVAQHPTDPTVFATGGADDVAFLCCGDEITALPGHTDSIVAVAFSRCGKYLACGSMDGRVSLWLLADMQAIYMMLDGPGSEVNVRTT